MVYVSSGSSEYVVVSRRSPIPILLVILVIMNAISVFASVSYMSRVSELEKEVRDLRLEARLLRSAVSELSSSIKPTSVAFEFYIKFAMARALAELMNISIYDALRIIEYGNATSVGIP